MKIGMIFPGYGHQIIGQGKELYEQFRSIQDIIEEAGQCLSVDFYKICFVISEQERQKPHNAFPFLCTWQYALFTLLEQEGIKPQLLAGHDIGLYSALCSARSITFPDILYLGTKLATWYGDVETKRHIKALRVEGISERIINKICKEVTTTTSQACIAISETPDVFFVIGDAESIVFLEERVRAEHAQRKEVETELYGLPLVCVAHETEQFTQYLAKIDCKNPMVPLLSYTGKEITTGRQVRTLLTGQLLHSLQWHKMMMQLVSYPVNIIVGYAPAWHKQLLHYYPERQWLMFSHLADLEEIKNALKKYEM
ncbi:MAG: acyltransferase domain-containing protein [Candidatus Babeliaceae bacterium]